MTRRLRSLMMWLLLLALPVQGFAAATMVNCGPSHHQMSAASSNVDHANHDHHGLSKLSKFKCSACAACCIGAALPPAPLAFFPPAPAVAPDAFVPASHIGFVTGGPDRPPRILRA